MLSLHWFLLFQLHSKWKLKQNKNSGPIHSNISNWVQYQSSQPLFSHWRQGFILFIMYFIIIVFCNRFSIHKKPDLVKKFLTEDEVRSLVEESGGVCFYFHFISFQKSLKNNNNRNSWVCHLKNWFLLLFLLEIKILETVKQQI